MIFVVVVVIIIIIVDEAHPTMTLLMMTASLWENPDMQWVVLTRSNNQHEVEGRKGGRRA